MGSAQATEAVLFYPDRLFPIPELSPTPHFDEKKKKSRRESETTNPSRSFLTRLVIVLLGYVLVNEPSCKASGDSHQEEVMEQVFASPGVGFRGYFY